MVASKISRKLIDSKLLPRRVFIVTGIPVAAFTARTISPHLPGSDIRAEPEPERRTFGTGQPMFMSKKLTLGFIFEAMQAALAISSGLLPNNWSPVG